MESKDKKEIEQALKIGASKSFIYENYSQRLDNVELTKFLASRPGLEIKKKLRPLNIFLIILWSIIFLAELLSLFDEFILEGVIFSTITGYILLRVARFDGNIYLSSSFWGLWGIIYSLGSSLYLADQDLADPDLVLAFWSIGIIYVIIALTSYIIRKLAFPYYKWFTPKKDERGNFRYEK